MSAVAVSSQAQAQEGPSLALVAPSLRPYQFRAVNAVLGQFKAGTRSTMLVLATGLGKTVVFSYLASRARGRVLVLAHRDELIRQAHDKLVTAAPGKHVGIVKARVREWDRHIVVASVQSLTPRHFDSLPPDISLVICDEAHHSGAASYQAIFQHLKAGQPGGPYLLGVTATPNRADGKGLASTFQSVAFEYSLFDAISDGWLSPLRALRIRTGVNLAGVKTERGDFAQGQLEDAVNTANRNELCLKAWQEHAATRKTLGFTAGVHHAFALAELFRANGVKAAAVCGDTPQDERRAILRDFSAGDLQAVFNAQVLTEGYDEPSVECILSARPIKSQGLFIQVIGRGTRIHPGKADCLILDLSDNVGRHRLVQLADLAGAEKAEREGLITLEDEGGGDGLPEPEKQRGEGIHAEEVDLGLTGSKKAKKAKREKVVLEWVQDIAFGCTHADLHDEVRFSVFPSISINGGRVAGLQFWVPGYGWGGVEIIKVRAKEDGPQVLAVGQAIAQVMAEDYVKAKAAGRNARSAIDPRAPWRAKTATTAQIDYAEMCVPGCSTPRDGWRAMTAGEASDVITLYKARKRVAKLEAQGDA